MPADEQSDECGCVRCATGLTLEDIANVLAHHMIEMGDGDANEMAEHVRLFGLLLAREIMRVMAGNDGEVLQ